MKQKNSKNKIARPGILGSVRALLRGQGGFTAVEVGVAALAVTGAIIVSVQIASRSKAVVEKGTDKTDAMALADYSVVRMKNMLLDVGTMPNRMTGACRMMGTAQQSAGVGIINATFFPKSTNGFSAEWEKAFPAAMWTYHTSISGCESNGYRKCLTLKEGVALPGFDEKTLGKNPMLDLQVIPTFVRNPDTGKSVNPIPLSATTPKVVDARDVGFVLAANVTLTGKVVAAPETILAAPTTPTTPTIPTTPPVDTTPTSTPPAEAKTKASSTGMIWTGQMTCDVIRADGRRLSLNPSGIGSGMTTGMVFSQTKLAATTVPDPIEIAWERREDVSTIIDPKTNVMTSKHDDKALSTLCVETQFTCRGAVSGQDPPPSRVWRNVMDVLGKAKYVPSATHTAQTLRVKPSFRFRTSDGTYEHVPPGTRYEFNNEPTASGEMVLVQEGRTIGMNIFAGGASGCEQICKEKHPLDPTNIRFNHTEVPASEGRIAKAAILFDILEPGFPGSKLVMESQPVGCGCCVTKQCRARGVQGTKVCHLAPDEALDSNIPECEIQRPTLVNATPEVAYPSTVLVAPDPSKCVAAKIAGDGIELKTFNCADSLPVLCYFQGQFQVARNQNQAAILRPFSGGHDACYRLSHTMLQKNELERLFTFTSQPIPAGMPGLENAGDPLRPHYTFYNAATYGLFLAPQTESQRKTAKVHMAKARDVDATLEYFWVGLRTGADSKPYADPPLVDTSATGGSVTPYTYFFELENEATPNPLTGNIEPKRFAEIRFQVDTSGNPFGVGDDLALFHSQRFRGAFGTAVGAELPAICRRDNGTYFKTSDTMKNLEEAHYFCAKADPDATFALPRTPMQWFNALRIVRPPQVRLPWPPGMNAAWIAARKLAAGGYEHPLTMKNNNRKRINYLGADKLNTDATHVLCKKAGPEKYELKKLPDTCDTNADFAFPPDTGITGLSAADLLFLNKMLVEKKVGTLLGLTADSVIGLSEHGNAGGNKVCATASLADVANTLCYDGPIPP